MYVRYDGSVPTIVDYRWGNLSTIVEPFNAPIPDTLLLGDWHDPLGASDFQETNLLWRPWTDGLKAIPTGLLQLRFTLRDIGLERPVLRSATIIFDAAELIEPFTDLAIDASGGFRLPIRRTWRIITYVIGTVATGSTGKYLIVVDRHNTYGPLVQIEDLSGTRVAGRADVTIGGA